ncbi:c670c875-9af0-48e7-b653-0dedd7dacae5 [Thermothielavioides terrestris]|uniref:G-protein coupled receptors family 2 profile 2 domain-containing protein n=2 Tax=Thermothielavioides terrestris TaxID=2587410 RepID=G2QYP6_THETT|nr:uncharacterized protein THITE_2114200 [Thermothielavioides terrestris NRRL 8126]AEO66238.1 hypothetical protein THITE_2114200 [Thermothielavioides terrestris NRRL 8126]SPQ25346.1 c670c875-9af0-48e7-b653-0dedd7dacae5 [Thermothielavioides terrestris]
MLHLRGEASLDSDQLATLTALTRAASALSAVGVLTIITTFCLSKHFRNPMHRLIVINAFYNAFDVTCTMISTSGPKAGNSSALCQFQGFLNQMFPIADVLWTLCMAINVYCIVFRNYDVESLRSLEWKYVIGITTVTFIPALVLLFIHSDENGPMYGSVTMWCAISPKWVLFRIILYYVPIWSCILITVTLYVLVGIEIAKRRRVLRSITSNILYNPAFENTIPPSSSGGGGGGGGGGTHDSNSCGNSTSAEYDDAAPRDEPVSSPTGASSSSKHYAASTTRLTTTPRASPLSFRHYILMPLFFFLTLLLVWVAPSTNRVASFVDPTFASYPLMLVVGVTGSLRGFWNGIVFVVVGMRSWKRRRELDEMALRPVERM